MQSFFDQRRRVGSFAGVATPPTEKWAARVSVALVTPASM